MRSRRPPELPQELWTLIARRRTAPSALLQTCRATRDAVLEVVQQRYALNRLQAWAFARCVYLRQSFFLTGGAGVGKSHVLRAIVRRMHQWIVPGCAGAMAIAAPTGAAARVASTHELRAQTLHRLFNIRARPRKRHAPAAQLQGHSSDAWHEGVDVEVEDADEEARGHPTAVIDKATLHRLRNLQFLILDEVSMVSADMLALIHDALQLARDSTRRFGGLHIVACGDFYQFAPVARGAGAAPWAFASPLWRFPTIELVECVRQSDAIFAGVLNRVRRAVATQADVDWLNAHTGRWTDGECPAGGAILPTNRACAEYNAKRLAAVPGECVYYPASVATVELVSTAPTWTTRRVNVAFRRIAKPKSCAETLALKLGCVVRSTRNGYARGLDGESVLQVANGQVGTVVALHSDAVEVSWEPVGQMPRVSTHVFPVLVMRRQRFRSAHGNPVYASTRQLPLALAWARTLHLAQGASIDVPVGVDARATEPADGGAHWVTKPAAAYVALSRVTQVHKIRLVAPLKLEHICADAQVRAWDAARR